ncbi:MAG: rhomboid family intramembrane serine protease [Pseudomonadota bacterium]
MVFNDRARPAAVQIPPATGVLLALLLIAAAVDALIPIAPYLAFVPALGWGLTQGIDVSLAMGGWIVATALGYGLVHSGLPHLVFNAMMLLVWGTAIERGWGWRMVVGIFIAGILAGAAGGMAYVTLTDQAYVVLIGASAGVQALLGAYIMTLWCIGRTTHAAGLLAAILIGEVLLALGLLTDAPVAWFSHLAGLACGGFLIALRTFRAPR